MTKRLEDLLNLPVNPAATVSPAQTRIPVVTTLEETLKEVDKITSALPKVTGLGALSDHEFDGLAAKAERAYDDLMVLGMNVETRSAGKIFEVANSMLNAAIAAKSAKIDKKLKIVDLQLKKLAIEKKHSAAQSEPVESEGYIVTDRNSILEKLKQLKN